MKKIYETPNMNIVRVEQQLLDGTSLTKSESTISSNDDVLSRRRGNSLWDDDEE